MEHFCQYCYFSLNGTPGTYPCLSCRLNYLFPSALKDCPNYFTNEPCPENITRSEYALQIKKENSIRIAKNL